MDDTRGARGFQFSRLVRASGYVAVLMALGAAAGTFLVLIGLTPIAPTPSVVFIAMVVNGALVAFLVAVIAWVVGSLLVARSRGQAGASLHIRIVALFSLVAVLPAALLAVTASVTLDRGLDNWFSTRTRAIIDNSLSLAQAFAEQQAVLLRSDILGAKLELERASSLHKEDPVRFAVFLNGVATDHNLPGVFLVSGDGVLITQARSSRREDFPPPVIQALKQAQAHPDQVVIVAPGATNIIGGITALQGYDNTLLYAARPLDPKVVHYLAMTNDNVAEYRTLEATRFGTQVAFAILFLGVTVVVLLSAIWLGIGFANRLVAPIRRLIDAAKEVSRGNLDVSVNPRNSDGDVGALGSTFNTMTAQLRSQRQELVAASEQIDARRRFTEAVLAGISAGVVGVDAQGRMTIVNRTALHLLGITEPEAIGTPVAELMPRLEPVVTAALRDLRPEHRDQITINRDGRERTINVRVTTERGDAVEHGYVITLDDISDLVAAQRSTAWADIARRIAHEIKNPLTPIQLSAERLKRKFGRTIAEDREVFDQCTDTIIRQVGDIGRMVDEFSSFARMPKPAFIVGDLAESIRESVFLVSVCPTGYRLQGRAARDAPDRTVRRPADRAGVDQRRQERHRGGAGGARGHARAGTDHRHRRRRRSPDHRRYHRQWHRPAAREPPPPARAVHDHPREGHRPRPRHRRQDHRGAWRPHRTSRRPDGGERPPRRQHPNHPAARGRPGRNCRSDGGRGSSARGIGAKDG